MKDGFTRREHYKAAGLPEDKWGIPEMPVLLAHVWEWFCDLSAQRGTGVNGADPISWTEMQAYFSMRGEVPSQIDLKAIQQLDSIMLSDDKT